MRKIRRWGVWLLLIIPLALNAQQRAEKLLNVPSVSYTHLTLPTTSRV